MEPSLRGAADGWERSGRRDALNVGCRAHGATAGKLRQLLGLGDKDLASLGGCVHPNPIQERREVFTPMVI